MNVTNVATRTFPKLRRAILDKGVLICCVTTAVILYGIEKLGKIRGKRRRSEILINYFLVGLTYIETLFIV
jgi:predicted nucleic acid-binding protein